MSRSVQSMEYRLVDALITIVMATFSKDRKIYLIIASIPSLSKLTIAVKEAIRWTLWGSGLLMSLESSIVE